MELLPLLCLCLLTRSGITSADENGPTVITVGQGNNAVLPCSLSTKENIEFKQFVWRKDPQKDDGLKEVFLYDGGFHYNNGLDGQSEEFIGRVFHFQDELKHGNASIIIRNTKISDSGVYTCDFPHLQPHQTFYIKLVLGVSLEPSVTSLEVTKNWARLQCKVKGASPKPEVEWQDSDGKRLPAEERPVSKPGGPDDIILLTTVTKTGNYRCVVTQREFNQQTASQIHVYIQGPKNITVEGGADVILPCSLSTKENITSKLFDWRKVAQKDESQKELFLYNAGKHYNNGLDGQSEEFKGRVSHFQDELKHGNSSIIIRNTKISDSGEYTCDFPRLQSRQIFYIELVVEPKVITVKEDSDVVLPCSLSTKENITSKLFDWKKVAQKDDCQKDLFFYNGGIDRKNCFPGRVSYFPDELKHGNASIIFRNTKMTDSGVYTCDFPNLQPRNIYTIKLVVDGVLKDRSEENIPGAASKPKVVILHQRAQVLQCEVHGNPKPNVELQDSDGNNLHAKVTQDSEREGSFYITLQTTVTKTGNYRCVATQEEIKHQIYVETSVHISGLSTGSVVGLVIGIVALLLFAAGVLAGLVHKGYIPRRIIRGPKVITVEEGSDVILPCSLWPKKDLRSMWFGWKKTDDQMLYIYDNGHVCSDDLLGWKFKGRVSHFPDKLKQGNASIIIRNTTWADSGEYRCDFSFIQKHLKFHTKLVVEPKVITVPEGSDVTLPCSLITKEDITSTRFIWEKVSQTTDDDQKVFLYDNGDLYSDERPGQSEQFKGRVSHFPEELKQGNASITIRNTTWADSGVYRYSFSFNETTIMFHIKLDVIGSTPEPDELHSLMIEERL